MRRSGNREVASAKIGHRGFKTERGGKHGLLERAAEMRCYTELWRSAIGRARTLALAALLAGLCVPNVVAGQAWDYTVCTPVISRVLTLDRDRGVLATRVRFTLYHCQVFWEGLEIGSVIMEDVQPVTDERSAN